MNRDLSNIDYQPTDKLGKLLLGQKDTFAPAVSVLGERPRCPRGSDAYDFRGRH